MNKDKGMSSPFDPVMESRYERGEFAMDMQNNTNIGKATPRPWKQFKHAVATLNYGQICICDKEFNAKLIVKAVNMHDELIHLCKWSLACMKNHNTGLTAELKKAIAKAESNQ